MANKGCFGAVWRLDPRRVSVEESEFKRWSGRKFHRWHFKTIKKCLPAQSRNKPCISPAWRRSKHQRHFLEHRWSSRWWRDIKQDTSVIQSAVPRLRRHEDRAQAEEDVYSVVPTCFYCVYDNKLHPVGHFHWRRRWRLVRTDLQAKLNEWIWESSRKLQQWVLSSYFFIRTVAGWGSKMVIKALWYTGSKAWAEFRDHPNKVQLCISWRQYIYE